MSNKDIDLSRCLCYILRHNPSSAGVRVNEHGWAVIDELISRVSAQGWEIDRERLERIVREDDKTRYSFSSDGTMIRCNHGHSITVDLELSATQPPEVLLHGTGDVFVEAIRREGLISGARMYVHLTEDRKVAMSVGGRHGKPVVFRVRSGEMARDGYEFFRSASGVWLTWAVPPKYLEPEAETEAL
ncbi:MAG: RNA 2'-phosphotransferase [Clostridia bacterium]|nr:RNA 2'-phosphotransferase [Clostridia bacterium]